MPGRTAIRAACIAALVGSLSGCSEEIAGLNRKPMANAGPDRIVAVEQPAILDGKNSYDPDGDTLFYYWTVLAAPEGGVTELSWDAGPEALLVPNLPGVWVIRLVVSDGDKISDPDVVTVRAGAGICLDDSACDDQEECTEDVCQDGVCLNEPVPTGTPCGSACQELSWVQQTCQQGACTGSEILEDCDDANACTSDSCDAQDGCGHEALPAGADCGICSVCDQQGDCTDDLDQHEDCPVCQRCAGGGTCENQADGSDLKQECNDSWYCNGLEVCNGQGACRGDYSPCPGLECDEELDACVGCSLDSECPPCQQCIDSTCVDQPVNSDLKDDCPPSDCGSGACDGHGACGMMPAGAQCSDSTPGDCSDARCDGVGNCDQAYALEGAAFECRPAAGLCDLPELCDGENPDCPEDRLWPDVTKCRPATGRCDIAEYCDGIGVNCPPDQLEPVTTECREAAGICDLAEFCDGQNPDCPQDVMLPDTTECRASLGICDPAEFCDGMNPVCPADELSPETQECRAAGGACDQAEFCDGLTVACPGDQLVADGTECRPVGGDCDIAEQCDGLSPDCPADAVKPGGEECRTAAGVCDLAESCDGSSAACPVDEVRPSGEECRAAVGVCDQAETCDGSGVDCPPDELKPDTEECRPANGDCDSPENCDGVGVDCPDDAFLPDTAECRESGGDCDVPEFCQGTGPDCPADDVEPSGTLCRDSADQCDTAEYCDGSGVDCPADEMEPVTTICRDAVLECDLTEYCDGLNPACPADAVRPDGTTCLGGDLEECNSTCQNGICEDDTPADDFTPCQDGAGICCFENCWPGYNCCSDSDCDDLNRCTTDSCSSGSCVNSCPDPDCMDLEIPDPISAGNPNPLNIHMCDAGLDPAWFNCYSARNYDTLVREDFEAGLGSFDFNGVVGLVPEAQSPLPGSIGILGARICQAGSYLQNPWIDTSGRSGIGLSFSVDDSTLDGNAQMLSVIVGSGSREVSLLLRGDGMNEPYRSYVFTLPTFVDDGGFWLAFAVLGGGFMNCAYLDDVRVFDAPPSSQVQTLLDEDFILSYGSFNRYDPQGNDVERMLHDGRMKVRITDDVDAHIVSDPIDTTGVDPRNRLVLEWIWQQVDWLDPGEYVLVEYSVDNGSSFRQLSSTGCGYAPSPLTTYWAVLPCEAVGIPDLRIRLRAPISAGMPDWEGIWIDDVVLREFEPNWMDSFGEFSDAGNGIYTGTITPGSAGDTSVACSHGCGPTQLWSDWVNITVSP